jgi:hypothetical protein
MISMGAVAKANNSGDVRKRITNWRGILSTASIVDLSISEFVSTGSLLGYG